MSKERFAILIDQLQGLLRSNAVDPARKRDIISSAIDALYEQQVRIEALNEIHRAGGHFV